MFEHEIKPVTNLDVFDVQRVRQLTQSFGAVCLPPHQIEDEEVAIFAAQSHAWGKDMFYKVGTILNGEGPVRIPQSLLLRIKTRAEFLCELTNKQMANRLIHFNQLESIHIDWHMDDIPEYWIYDHVDGERRLEFFSPEKPCRVPDLGTDRMRISKRDIVNAVATVKGKTDAVPKYGAVAMTSNFAHRSGESLKGLAYTLL